jgi:large subunit ribosomal protein L19
VDLLKIVEKKYLRQPGEFNIGDTINVHVKIVEGSKERIQVFSGVAIARRGTGTGETFTVRRIVSGEGVERVFAICSPRLEKIVVAKRGRVRRAKLYYLRDRVGKATRIKEVQKVSVTAASGKASEEKAVAVS